MRNETAATTEIQLRHKSELPVDIPSCQGSRHYSPCILHFVDKDPTENSLNAVFSTESEDSSVEELSNKERELTEIKSCSTGSKVQGRVDCAMEAHELPAVPEDLQLTSIQHPLNDSLLGDDRQCHNVAGMVDEEDIEALFRSVDSYSNRLEKEEEQSEVLTKEAGDLRTYLEKLWNELMETKEHLIQEFPIEEIQSSRVNNGSKSGCNLTIPEAFEMSPLTGANCSSQDFSLEAKAVIDQLPHVEICCSSEVGSHDLLFSEEEAQEEESRTPSVYTYDDYSETSSILEELLEEQLGQFEDLESGEIERSLEPNFEALFSAYDIESLVDEFNGREEEESKAKKQDPALLNSAMSIYNDEPNETRPKSELQESSTMEEDSDPAQKCEGVSNKITQELESGEFKEEEGLSVLETTSVRSPRQVKWTEHCPEVFEEEETVDDGDLVEVYKQETKELAAAKTKRLWFFSKEKRLWPKCPKRSKTWFHKLFRKFRIFPSKNQEQK